MSVRRSCKLKVRMLILPLLTFSGFFSNPATADELLSQSSFSHESSTDDPTASLQSTSGLYESLCCETETWWQNLRESPNLLGDFGGRRSCLADQGITYQGFLTQFYQGAAAGGNEQRFSYGGKFDNFLILDGQKMGLWQGLFVNMHAETRFGEDANRDAVGFAPVNANMLWPSLTQTTALSGLTVTQALSEEWLVSAGKFNTLDLFAAMYPQSGRGIDGFMNVSTLFPLTMGRALGLSVNGIGVTKLHEGQVQGSLSIADAQNSSTTIGISDMFDKGALIIGYWRLFTDFACLPGSHAIMGEYSTRNYTSLNPIDFVFVPPLGLVASQKSETWSLGYLAEQKLWIDSCNSKRNVGLFSSWGISDGNPNPIRWSGNVSLQAHGISQCRENDSFGVAYFYTGLSNDFQNLASPIVALQDVQGGEVFYNFAVTPWMNVTPDLQIIQPANAGQSTAIVVGMRGKLTF